MKSDEECVENVEQFSFQGITAEYEFDITGRNMLLSLVLYVEQ